MKNIIITTLAALSITILITEAVSFGVEGSYLSDKKQLKNLEMNIEGYHFYKYVTGNISTIKKEGYPYIHKTVAPLICKYEIEGIGRVPRWTKMHGVLESYYDSLITNDTRTKWNQKIR